MEAESAYDMILDGSARLNLATFVTTWMEPPVEKLMAESFDKNLTDKDEYPAAAKIEERCVNILSDLFPSPETGVGASASGSSEAVMLAAIVFKRKYRMPSSSIAAARESVPLGGQSP